MTPKTRKLKYENDILIDELSPPARRCFRQITTHIRTAPINAYYQETLRHDILQMLIDAEEQDKTLEDVLGTDYGEFLDNAIAEVPPLTQRARRVRGVRGALLLVYFLTFYWFIVANNHLEHTWPMLPVTVGDLIGSALIILIALSFALFSRVLSRSPMTQLYLNSLRVRSIFFIWALLYLIIRAIWKTYVFSVYVPAVFAVLLIFGLLHRWIDRRND